MTPYVFLGPARVKGASALFDLRSLEPVSGATRNAAMVGGGVAYADVRVAHSEGRTIYHQVVTSPTLAPALPALVPPSRGSPCKVASADGRVTDRQPCPATDGDHSARVAQPGTARTSTTAIAGVTSVTVDLSTAVDVESVYVRNCDRSCVVEVSADGTTWARPQNVELLLPAVDPIAVARFTPVPGARGVRVSRPGGTVSLTEISAWPARPPGSPAPSPFTHQPTAGMAGRDRQVGVTVVAALLLGAVSAGLAAVAVARRHLA